MAEFQTVQAILLPGDPKVHIMDMPWGERHDMEYPDVHLSEMPPGGIYVATMLRPSQVVHLSPLRFIQCLFVDDDHPADVIA